MEVNNPKTPELTSASGEGFGKMNWGKRFYCLVLGIGLFFIALNAVFPSETYRVWAQEETKGVDSKVIRVGVENCEEIYMNHLNEADGYFNAYLEKLFQKTDPHTEFIFQYAVGDMQEMTDMLRSGQVDIVIGETRWQAENGEMLTLSSDLLKDLQIVDRELTIDRKVLYIADDDQETAYQDYAGFDGMSVGILQEPHIEELIEAYSREKGIKLNLLSYQHEDCLRKALDNGTVDAVIQNLYSSQYRKIVDYIGYTNKSILVNLENKTLLRNLEGAREKLYMEDANLRSALEDSFENKRTYRAFSKEEINFISECPVIKVVCSKNQVPLEYYEEESGTFKGIYIDVLKHVEEYTGLKFELIGADSYMDSIKLLQQGEADLLLSTYDLPMVRRENRLVFTEPYMSSNFYMVGRYDARFGDTVRYGITEQIYSPALVDFIEKDTEGWKAVLLPSKEECFSQAVEGQIDIAVFNEATAHYLLSQYTGDKVGVLGAVATDVGVCYAVSAVTELDHLMLRDILNQAIQEMQQEEFETINLVSSIAMNQILSFSEFIKENWYYFLAAICLAILVPAAIILINQVKNRARIYQQFLFRIISENVNNVVLIYNCKKQRMEYVFDNVSWVLGIESKEFYRNPDILNDYCELARSVMLMKEFNQKVDYEDFVSEGFFRNPVTHERLWIEVIVKAKVDSHGVKRYIITVTDLTNEKNSKTLLADALAGAEQASLAKTEFLSHISHEIRTPMNAIIGMTTIASKYLSDPDKVKDCLSKISISSKHLLSLINDILDMSKIDSGKMVLVSEPFALSELFDNVIAIILPQAKTKGIHFHIDITRVEHEFLVGDMLRVEQVLINLLSNAVKFTEEGGEVLMDIREQEVAVNGRILLEIRIQDNGIGMSEEFMNRLFEPFEQENRRTAQFNKGTGLGMSITRNIVSMMNGSIDVESELDKGTTFCVKLLLREDEQDREADGSELLKNLKILVADDEQDACENTSILLERLGMLADWVLTGREAVEKTVQAHEQGADYRAVIIDWRMPGMDGIETAKKIRDEVGSELPIIILSAYDWSEIEKEATEAGVNAFISKPMFRSKLYYTLLNVIQGNQENPGTFQMDNFAGRRFLLVEDNELNQEIAEGILKESGAAVELAGNGKEAVEKYEASPPGYYDLIFMDIQMPYMNGYEATQRIRGMSRADAAVIPIVAMTANAFSSDITESFHAGMNGHISKPIDVDILFDTIRRQLEHRSGKSAE